MTGIIIYVNEAVVSIVIKYKPRTVSLQAPQTDSHDSLVLEPTCLLKRSELGPWVQTHPSHTHIACNPQALAHDKAEASLKHGGVRWPV